MHSKGKHRNRLDCWCCGDGDFDIYKDIAGSRDRSQRKAALLLFLPWALFGPVIWNDSRVCIIISKMKPLNFGNDSTWSWKGKLCLCTVFVFIGGPKSARASFGARLWTISKTKYLPCKLMRILIKKKSRRSPTETYNTRKPEDLLQAVTKWKRAN